MVLSKNVGIKILSLCQIVFLELAYTQVKLKEHNKIIACWTSYHYIQDFLFQQDNGEKEKTRRQVFNIYLIALLKTKQKSQIIKQRWV